MRHIFCERLKQARKERGWTQAKLGYEAEMSLTQVKNYEKGYRLPNLECLIRLATALDYPTDFLCGLEE
jgi:transcriptional regulator with XRE-family HTH domain